MSETSKKGWFVSATAADLGQYFFFRIAGIIFMEWGYTCSLDVNLSSIIPYSNLADVFSNVCRCECGFGYNLRFFPKRSADTYFWDF